MYHVIQHLIHSLIHISFRSCSQQPGVRSRGAVRQRARLLRVQLLRRLRRRPQRVIGKFLDSSNESIHQVTHSLLQERLLQAHLDLRQQRAVRGQRRLRRRRQLRLPGAQRRAKLRE